MADKYKCRTCGGNEFLTLLSNPPQYRCRNCREEGRLMSDIADCITTSDNLKKCRYCKEAFVMWGGDGHYITCKALCSTEIADIDDIIPTCEDFELTDELKEVIK